MPDTGTYFLYEVKMIDGPNAPGNLLFAQCQCLRCHHHFVADTQPELVNIPGGGAVIKCPECGVHQAIAAQTFVDYLARFPSGKSTEVQS